MIFSMVNFHKTLAKVDGFIEKSFLLNKIISFVKGILDLPHKAVSNNSGISVKSLLFVVQY
jgi:hypothetical protein